MNREQWAFYKQNFKQVIKLVRSLKEYGINTMDAEIELIKLQSKISEKHENHSNS